jgi:hypothetical protein
VNLPPRRPTTTLATPARRSPLTRASRASTLTANPISSSTTSGITIRVRGGTSNVIRLDWMAALIPSHMSEGIRLALPTPKACKQFFPLQWGQFLCPLSRLAEAPSFPLRVDILLVSIIHLHLTQQVPSLAFRRCVLQRPQSPTVKQRLIYVKVWQILVLPWARRWLHTLAAP